MFGRMLFIGGLNCGKWARGVEQQGFMLRHNICGRQRSGRVQTDVMNDTKRQNKMQCRMNSSRSGSTSGSTCGIDLLLQHSSHIVREAWVQACVATGSKVSIDATAGRGSDTLALCEIFETVHAIDVQRMSIEETSRRFEEEGNKKCDLKLYESNHEDLKGVTGLVGKEEDEQNVAVVAYNLGWCPMREANEKIVTTPECTVKSLRSAQDLVCRSGGVITIMAYVGHEGGMEEKDSVEKWAKSLDKKEWNVFHLEYPNRNSAPHLFVCVRR